MLMQISDILKRLMKETPSTPCAPNKGFYGRGPIQLSGKDNGQWF